MQHRVLATFISVHRTPCCSAPVRSLRHFLLRTMVRTPQAEHCFIRGGSSSLCHNAASVSWAHHFVWERSEELTGRQLHQQSPFHTEPSPSASMQSTCRIPSARHSTRFIRFPRKTLILHAS